MTTANDDQLDAMLVRFLDAQAETIGARARGELTTADIIRRRVGRGPTGRPWLLMVAALLLAGAAALGLTVGAATLRDQEDAPLPPPQPEADALPAIPASAAIVGIDDCDLTFFGSWDGLAVRAVSNDAAGNFTFLTVHDDGSVVEARATPDLVFAPMTIRRLTADGVEQVRRTVADLVTGGHCATVETRGPSHSVAVRTERGFIDLAWGESTGGPLDDDPTDRDAVEALEVRLDDLASWLPRAAWVDPEPRPYVADTWSVWVEQPVRLLHSTDPAGPDPRAVQLPGGRDLLSFGRQAAGTPIGPPTILMRNGPAPARCTTVNADLAETIRTIVGEAGAMPADETHAGPWFTVPVEVAYDVVVVVTPLRPMEPACPEGPAAPAPTPAPTLSLTLPSHGIGLQAQPTYPSVACQWLDLPWARSATPRTLWHEACRR